MAHIHATRYNMLLVCLDGVYDARVRACIERFALELNISSSAVRRHEAAIASALGDAIAEKYVLKMYLAFSVRIRERAHDKDYI